MREGEENCRSLHGTPGQVGFARDDKREIGLSHNICDTDGLTIGCGEGTNPLRVCKVVDPPSFVIPSGADLSRRAVEGSAVLAFTLSPRVPPSFNQLLLL